MENEKLEKVLAEIKKDFEKRPFCEKVILNEVIDKIKVGLR